MEEFTGIGIGRLRYGSYARSPSPIYTNGNGSALDGSRHRRDGGSGAGSPAARDQGTGSLSPHPAREAASISPLPGRPWTQAAASPIIKPFTPLPEDADVRRIPTTGLRGPGSIPSKPYSALPSGAGNVSPCDCTGTRHSSLRTVGRSRNLGFKALKFSTPFLQIVLTMFLLIALMIIFFLPKTEFF